MKKYKCLEGFEVPRVDDDGFQIDNEFFEVEKNSIWFIDDKNVSITGADIRLENEDLEWVEISEEVFRACFVGV